jgi:flavodoxin
MDKAITIYDSRTGSTGTIVKAIEEGRERARVEVISKGLQRQRLPKILIAN